MLMMDSYSIGKGREVTLLDSVNPTSQNRNILTRVAK